MELSCITHVLIGNDFFILSGCLPQLLNPVDEQYKALFLRLEEELPALARLHMSTIGSSHRLPGDKNNDAGGDLTRAFGKFTLDDSDDNREYEPPKETIVIFDEAGCIPSFELLGIT